MAMDIILNDLLLNCLALLPATKLKEFTEKIPLIFQYRQGILALIEGRK